MSKGFKIGCWSIVALFLLFGAILSIFDISPPESIEETVSIPEKTGTNPSNQIVSSSAEETEVNENDISIVEQKKQIQMEWNLPENANLKQLLKTTPVSETLEFVEEPCKSYSANTVEYARKTLEVRQMLSLGRFRVEDIIRAEHNAGQEAYARAYDSKVIEVQGRFYRATLDGEIEFEVWDESNTFVVGVFWCVFPESQYNELHSIEKNSFVRIKGKLCISRIRPDWAIYRLIYCSFVD